MVRRSFTPQRYAGTRARSSIVTVPVGADATALAVDERTGKVFAAAMNVYGLPAGSDNTRWLRAWLRRWPPWSWVSRLLPPAPAPTTGTVTMLDLARVPA